MDVIGLEPELDALSVRVRRRAATGRVLPFAAGLALTAAALIGFLFGRAVITGGLFDTATAGHFTGRMVLEGQPSVAEERLGVEYHDDEWKGTITVEAGSKHTGTAHLKGSTSAVRTDSGHVGTHVYGTAEVTLDGQSCKGTYGHSIALGGFMHLRCGEGSVLGATLTLDGVSSPVRTGTGNWRMTLALTEGYLFTR